MNKNKTRLILNCNALKKNREQRMRSSGKTTLAITLKKDHENEIKYTHTKMYS